MIKGSCLCGGVKFEINEARSLTYCDCRNCRKLSGAHVASYVHVDADKFRFVAGEKLIQTFESAPGSFRIARLWPGKAPYLATSRRSAFQPGFSMTIRMCALCFMSSFAPKCLGSR